MNRLTMSRQGAALMRALLDRAGEERNRILLTEIHSTEWRSLTFSGERHCIDLRIIGAAADAILSSFTAGLRDAEFSLTGSIVADIGLAGAPVREADGSYRLRIEALTLEDN